MIASSRTKISISVWRLRWKATAWRPPLSPEANTLAWPDFVRRYNETVEATRGGRVDAMNAPIVISSLGAFGVRAAAPIVVPPSVGTLFVGSAHYELSPNGKKAQSVEVITLSLTFDHRVVNGAGAANFVHEIKEQIEGFEFRSRSRRRRRRARISSVTSRHRRSPRRPLSCDEAMCVTALRIDDELAAFEIVEFPRLPGVFAIYREQCLHPIDHFARLHLLRAVAAEATEPVVLVAESGRCRAADPRRGRISQADGAVVRRVGHENRPFHAMLGPRPAEKAVHGFREAVVRKCRLQERQ